MKTMLSLESQLNCEGPGVPRNAPKLDIKCWKTRVGKRGGKNYTKIDIRGPKARKKVSQGEVQESPGGEAYQEGPPRGEFWGPGGRTTGGETRFPHA